MKQESQVIFDRNVVEFVTVAAEFCKFLEQAENNKRKSFVDTSLKLLPLLYLKASMLPHCDIMGDEAPETYVTEETYEETYKFIEKWKGRVTIHSHPFDPLPGSKWQYEKATEVPAKLVKAVKSLEGIGRVFGRVTKDKEKVCRI